MRVELIVFGCLGEFVGLKRRIDGVFSLVDLSVGVFCVRCVVGCICRFGEFRGFLRFVFWRVSVVLIGFRV